MQLPITVLGYACIASAVFSLCIMGFYFLMRPPMDFRTKMWLFVGLGVLPAASATSSTVTGMQATTGRQFCGSCHVMGAYTSDADNGDSQSLAARHARNPFFGKRNCYVCHADYGMLGYPLTKLNGMRHVYEYYLGGWKQLPTEQALDKIHLRKPYDNTNCRQCHSGTLADWGSVPEHVALEKELTANSVSCASSGCHGFAHPFSKKDGASAMGLPGSAIGSDRRDVVVPSALPAEARRKLDDARREQQRGRSAASAEREASERARRDTAKKAATERGAPAGGGTP